MAEEPNDDQSSPAEEPGDGPASEEPDSSPDEPGGDDPSADDLEPDEFEQRDTADTFNIVYNVAGDHVGDVGSNPRRRRTGRLSEDEAWDSVRGFVQPPGYGDALADLLDRRLAVLAGDGGSGRRCAATSLLLGLPGTSGHLVVLPPSKTVEELGRHAFRTGRRYLLPDLPVAPGDPALRRHDADVLVEQLDTTGAYLIVTTSVPVGSKQFGDLVRPWRPVAASELVAAFRSTYPGAVDADGEKQLIHVCDTLTPSATRRVLSVVLDEGLDKALASRDAMGRRAVQEWFDADPEDRDVVRTAVVAFVPFCDRRGYGRNLARLRELIGWEGPSGPEPLRQEFVELRAIPLISTERRGEDGVGVPLIEPVSRDVHTAVVAELLDRYGPGLLEPLRQLQDELAEIPDGATQLSVAYGMAMLARVDPDEVTQRLWGWADGYAPRRRTAAFVLALMCTDDATADVALQVATSWSRGAGDRRAATAATAFGLTLARRFPADAVSHLWALALRSTQVGRYARLSLCALAQDSAADTAALRDLLRTIERQMRRLLVETPRRPRREMRGTDAILALLRAPGPEEGSGSMSAVVLREHPDLVELLGALWAEVLCSRPHRGAAVRALRGDLDSLDVGRDAHAVERLGAEIRRRLAPEQWAWLRRDLPGEGWLW